MLDLCFISTRRWATSCYDIIVYHKEEKLPSFSVTPLLTRSRTRDVKHRLHPGGGQHRTDLQLVIFIRYIYCNEWEERKLTNSTTFILPSSPVPPGAVLQFGRSWWSHRIVWSQDGTCRQDHHYLNISPHTLTDQSQAGLHSQPPDDWLANPCHIFTISEQHEMDTSHLEIQQI